MLYCLSVLILSLLFCLTAFAGDTAKYKEAIKVATDAALKQSGLETDWFKVRSASETKAKKTVRKLGLEKPAAVAAFVIPVVVKQKVRLKSGDFTFQSDKKTTEFKWQFQW